MEHKSVCLLRKVRKIVNKKKKKKSISLSLLLFFGVILVIFRF